jgi:hypothetical protein
LSKTGTEFPEQITKELITLSSYLQEQMSRITLYQVIEVNLESLLMVKKALIDISLKSNIFVFDFGRYMATPEITVSGKRGSYSRSGIIGQ